MAYKARWEIFIDIRTLSCDTDLVQCSKKSYEYSKLSNNKNNYDKLRQHIKQQRHNLANKVCRVKDTVFLVVMYACESWTIKKAEHQRIDAFELQC